MADQVYGWNEESAQRIANATRLVETTLARGGNAGGDGVRKTARVFKITAHSGSGVYTANEVYWDGSGWSAKTNSGANPGSGDVPSLREFQLNEDVPVDTIVVGWYFPESTTSTWAFAYEPDTDTDELVKVSANDTTAGYLYGKVNIDPDSTLTSTITDTDSPMVYAEKDNAGDEDLFVGFDIDNLTAVTTTSASDLFVISQGTANKSRKITKQNLQADLVPGVGTNGVCKNGGYTGDGTASLDISGLGFDPVYVVIFESDGLNRWDKLEGTTTTTIHDATGHSTSDNVTLGTDKFTVDEDSGSGPNANATDYKYIAFGCVGSGIESFAADFDGADYLDGGDVLDVGTNDFSVAFWAKSSQNGTGRIVCKEGSVSAGWSISITTDGSAGYIQSTIQVDSSNYRVERTDASHMSSTWKHFVFAWDRSAQRCKIYVNGSLVNSSIDFSDGSSTGDITSTAPFRFGSRDVSGNELYFTGSVCDVGVWIGRELSASDAAALYNAGNRYKYENLSSSLTTSLDSWYACEEATGATRADSEGSNDLTDNNTVDRVTGP